MNKTANKKQSVTTEPTIAELSASLAQLTTLVTNLISQTASVPAVSTKAKKAKKGKTKNADAEAKKAAHNAKKAEYENARKRMASMPFDKVVEMAAREIIANAKANAVNANIASDCSRKYLSSVTNQGFMNAWKVAGIPYGTAMSQLDAKVSSLTRKK